MAFGVQAVCKMIFHYPTLHNDLVIKHLHVFCVRWQIICHKQKYGGGGSLTAIIAGETILILSLTDRTDCTDFFARATCFSTTETTELTDFVSIACSLRY